MYEEKELLNLLAQKIEFQIQQCNEQIKTCKKDAKKLLKAKDDIIETGIDDYVFDDNIARIMNLKDNLDEKMYKLKKIKYRLDVAKRMFEELN